MKLFTVFMLFFVFGAAANSYSQKQLVSLNLHRSDVNTLFQEIWKQTGLRFVYNEKHVENLARFNIKVEKKSVEEVLNKVFKNTLLSYFFENNMIYVIRNQENYAPKDTLKIVSGVVKDEKGIPLPGVTVRIKGSTLGGATNKDGRFKFNLPKKDSTLILVFTFIGMETREITLKDQKEIQVVMKEEKVKLEDVVITGYANISRQSFTGNVRTITAAELKKISPTNILKSIQVLDPSFRIAVNNDMGSNPNVLPEISIRGASGIGLTEFDTQDLSKTALQNNPNLPTFIMDGFEVKVEKVYDLDPNRIESITILKDAAATAIYGSRAANGVIVITTVASKEGRIMLTYNYDLNLQVPDLSDYNLMGAREKIEAEKAAGLFDEYPDYIIYYYEKLRLLEKGVNTDWMFYPLRNSTSGKHYLRLEGGSKGLHYGIDVNYHENNGVMRGSERKKFSLGFDIRYNVERLIFRNMASYSGVNYKESPFGVFSQYTLMNPYYSYLDSEGKIAKNIMEVEGLSSPNPLYEAYIGNYNKSKDKEFIDNFSVQYYFTNKLHFKANIALTYKTGQTNVFTAPESGRYSESDYKGEMELTDISSTNVDGGIFGYYNDVLGKHYVNLVAGINLKENQDESKRVFLRDFPEGGFTDPQFAREVPKSPSTFEQKTRLFGAMASLNYTCDNIYLLDATWRLDGNSSFGTETRFAPFWSAGLGMNIHNCPFMKRIKWITELKIRGSYGITGKANFPARTARTVYTLDGETIYPTGASASITAMGNRELKWEKTKITDIGGSLNLFSGLVYFKGTYYFRRTIDLIADISIPASSGFLLYKENIGEISNNGYELDVRCKVIERPKTQLYFSANLASNRNKIEKLSDAMKAYNQKVEEKYQDQAASRETKKPFLKYEDGASVTSIYAMSSLGIDPQTGKELFRYKNGSVENEWLASENVAVGNTEPKINGTLSGNLYFHGLTLDAYFTYTYGGDLYNQTLQSKIENADLRYNVDRRVFTERWKNAGDVCRFKSLKDYNKPTNATSRFVEKDNTLTLQSLSVGYEVPSRILDKFYFSTLRFSFNMNDVFRISSVKQERGVSYPFARSYFFSLSVSL